MKQQEIILVGAIIGVCALGAAAGYRHFYGTTKNEDAKDTSQYEDNKRYNILVNPYLTHICRKDDGYFQLQGTFDFAKHTMTDYTNDEETKHYFYPNVHHTVQPIDDLGADAKLDNFYLVEENGVLYLCQALQIQHFVNMRAFYEINLETGAITAITPNKYVEPSRDELSALVPLGIMTFPPNKGGKRRTRNTRRRRGQKLALYE
jgi:hypothetical protein